MTTLNEQETVRVLPDVETSPRPLEARNVLGPLPSTYRLEAARRRDLSRVLERSAERHREEARNLQVRAERLEREAIDLERRADLLLERLER
jgi:hypothetical protein